MTVYYSEALLKAFNDRKVTIPQDVQDLLAAEKCDECDAVGMRYKTGDFLYGSHCTCEYGRLMHRREGDKPEVDLSSGACSTEELNIICDTVVDLAHIYGENNKCPDIRNFAIDLFKAIFSGYAECKGK